MKYVLIIALLLVGWSCSTRPKVPREFPDEKAMAELLADIYLAEGTINNAGYYRGKPDDKIPGYYRYVLDQHGLTKQEFDTVVAWYTAHPIVFDEVYEDVISILSEKEGALSNELNNNREEISKAPELAMEVDLWKGRRFFKLPLAESDSIDPRLPYQFDMDSVKGGVYSIQARYSFKEENEVNEAHIRMIACYADCTKDSIVSKINSNVKGIYTSKSLSANARKNLISIEGFLFDHDTAFAADVEIKGVKLKQVPPMNALRR